MLKQELSQTCICGQTMSFPEGQIKAKCLTKDCGANWELGAEGFWLIRNITPIQNFKGIDEIQLAKACEQYVRSIVEAFKPVIEAMAKWSKDLWDKFMESAAKGINPKWWYYYKHAKKQRTRKKYQKRIWIHLKNFLTTAPSGENSLSQSKGVEMQKGPQERTLQADQQRKIPTESIPQECGHIPFSLEESPKRDSYSLDRFIGTVYDFRIYLKSILEGR